MLTLILVTVGASMAACADYTVSKIHLSQGNSPESMTVSWVTRNSAESEVRYGTDKNNLNLRAFGDSDTYKYSNYYYGNYTSGYYHHTIISNLKPDTKYYYQVGDYIANYISEINDFETLHAVGDLKQMNIGVIGDLGQTTDSLSTMNHLISNTELKLILHVGDLGYANCNQTSWDTYGDMTEVLSSKRPWMVGAGNHEIEANNNNDYFLAFEKRYRMSEHRAEFGAVTIPSNFDALGIPQCTPSVFQMEYNYGNSFYSFNSGSMHSIFVNCYSTNDINSEQYKWLERDLSSVNRDITPWVIVSVHCPWYSSNTAHYQEKHTVEMKNNMEDLFYKHHVNVVLAGHVHAYERSYPVYKDNLANDGVVYIVIGDGGNAEGHAATYHTPTPVWSAFRNGTQYGHGILKFDDASHLEWEWHRNIDGEPILKDSIKICNTALGLNAYC